VVQRQCVAWARKLYAASVAAVDREHCLRYGAEHPCHVEGERIRGQYRLRFGRAWARWWCGMRALPVHVGVVTKVTRDRKTGAVTEIIVSEANFGPRPLPLAAKKWGLTEAEARSEFVTEKYGIFDETRFAVSSLDRGLFKFAGFVYP